MKVADAVHNLHIEDREVPDDTFDLIAVRSRIQQWASENAYTLVFLSIMFFITWSILIVSILQHWLA